MKKLLLILAPCLLACTVIFAADPQTTGSMKLLMPSTNTVDKSRSWGDKLNENFRIIDATVTGVMVAQQSIATSTSTLLTMISTTGVQVANLSAATSTLAANLSASTGTLLTMVSTTGVQVANVSAATTSIANRAAVISIYDNTNTFLGNATTVKLNNNLTASFSGSTVTVNASGGGGGSLKSFDLYVGTPGFPNMDIIANESRSFQSMFSTGGQNGLTLSSSVTVRYFLNSGVYVLSDTTIPAGAELYCGSSVTFVPGANDRSMMTVYGKIYGMRIDAASRPFIARLIQVKSNARIEGIRSSTGMAGMDQSSKWMSVFDLNGTTTSRITGDLTEFTGCVQDENCGGLATLNKSSDNYINLNTIVMNQATTGKQVYFVGDGDKNIIEGNYDNMGGRFAYIEGGNIGLQIQNSRHRITQGYGNSGGYIYLRSLNFTRQISTGVIINNNVFQDEGGNATNPIIWFQGDNGVFGAQITNNHARCGFNTTTFPANFIRVVDTGVYNTIIANNHVFKMGLIQDAGTATTYTSLANTNDITKP